MLSPVCLCPSVCPPVPLLDGWIIEKRLKFPPYSSPIPLVFAVPSRNSKGFPQVGTSNKGGVGKISSFLSLSVNISKTVADMAKVT